MDKVTITQTRSDIGREPRVKATLKALGLGRIGKSNEIVSNAAVNGMIACVKHLVTVESGVASKSKKSEAIR